MAEYDITTLYRQHADRLKRYIRLRVQSADEVEDIVQTIFLELCRPGALEKVEKDVDAYLFGTARHVIAQHFKRKQRGHVSSWDESREPVSPPAESNSPACDVERIHALLKRLPPKACEALRLRYLDGLTSKEAATVAGCSEHTLYVRLYRAIRSLRGLVCTDADSGESPASAPKSIPGAQKNHNPT